MPLGRARLDTDARCGLGHRTSGCHERREDVDLPGGRGPREGAAQVPVSHETGLTLERVTSPSTTPLEQGLHPAIDGRIK